MRSRAKLNDSPSPSHPYSLNGLVFAKRNIRELHMEKADTTTVTVFPSLQIQRHLLIVLCVLRIGIYVQDRKNDKHYNVSTLLLPV